MKRTLIVVLAAVCSAAALAQERDRAKIPEQYTWNLAEIYPSDVAWRAAKDKLAAELPSLKRFEGKLASSASTLADALDRQSALDKELSRLYAYASMLADEDTRDSQRQGMRQEMTQLASAFGAETAFIEPELLGAGKATLDRLAATEPRLKVYRFYLEDVARRATHTLTAADERLLADAGPMASTAANAFGILSNADFPYPSITPRAGRP